MKTSLSSLSSWPRGLVMFLISLLHAPASILLSSYAGALGFASHPVPLWLKAALLTTGFPGVYPAYALRWWRGHWTANASYLWMVLTPLNTLLASWLLAGLLVWWGGRQRWRRSPA